jgi:hypothetical protein
MNYEYEKYITDNDHILDTLNKYGVAIIPDILNQQECNLIKQGMWDYLENITANLPVPIKKTNNVLGHHSVLLKHWSIGYYLKVHNY